MAKITIIIDIGSNSMRMVVFKKTSRFAFHLIHESKSKVKISQNCYGNNGYLQEDAMQRAFYALESFLNISNNLKAKKILCIATSAVREAPNAKVFLQRVKKELGVNIKIIDGKQEALYGGIAANNLLHSNNFSTIDIGGGSTELALINNHKIIETISLDIGCIRIKELFFDKNDYEGAKKYILKELEKLPLEYFNIQQIVGLGGTIRALSKMIMKQLNYPLDILHGFEYDSNSSIEYFNKILSVTSLEELQDIGIKKDRFETIKPGTFIFITILEYLNIQKITASSVGIREGIYLSDILRNSNNKFPANFQISVRSLIDRFIDDPKQVAYLGNNIVKLFDELKPLHKLENSYKSLLTIAAKIQQVGISLNFHKNSLHSSNFILEGLNYGFSHQDRLIISTIIKFSKKPLPQSKDIEEYKDLLPSIEIIQWLSYIHSLNKILNSECLRYNYIYLYNENIFTVKSDRTHYLIQNSLNKLEKPTDFILKLEFKGYQHENSSN